jgi:hypothetical protein
VTHVSDDDLAYMIQYWTGCRNHIVELSDTSTAERTMAGNFVAALKELKDARAHREASPDDCVLLEHVCDAWVNGRRVLDGIPKEIADKVRLRLASRTNGE